MSSNFISGTFKFGLNIIDNPPPTRYKLFIETNNTDLIIAGTGQIGYSSINSLVIPEQTINAQNSYNLFELSNTPTQSGIIDDQSEKWDLFLQSDRCFYFVNIFSIPNSTVTMFSKFFLKCYLCKNFF
jgi:hypothetical protein